jgi:hypothetical protein
VFGFILISIFPVRQFLFMASDEQGAEILSQLLEDLPLALLALAVPSFLLYLSLYAFCRRWLWTFRALSIVVLVGFWVGEDVAPVRCAGAKAQLRFIGMWHLVSFCLDQATGSKR